MKRIIVVGFVIVGLLLAHSNVFAWGAAGHQLIAMEAYRQLSPELKAQVNEVLKAHPEYGRWIAAYHPNPIFDQYAYAFIRSANWPDEIRRSGNQYDHAEWHYIDYPLRPPGFAFEEDSTPTNNVLVGIAESEKALSDTNANPELRAAMLSYLVHLIGDEHQPLHAESLFTDVYPHGDKGGNDFYVKPSKVGVGLHGIWDSLLGSSVNPRIEWNYAIELDAKFPRTALPELTSHTTPREWSLESRQLAIDKGYLHGELKGGTNRDTAVPLPADYTKNAKAVGERQGALAGYRLADEIQKYLKCAATVPLLPPNTNVASQVALPKVIGIADAHKYYDENMVVTGKVVQVSERPTLTILDFERAGPTSPFTAVIFPDNVGKFTDLQKFKDKNVQITGTLTEYHNKPEMILESPDQIKILSSH